MPVPGEYVLGIQTRSVLYVEYLPLTPRHQHLITEDFDQKMKPSRFLARDPPACAEISISVFVVVVTLKCTALGDLEIVL